MNTDPTLLIFLIVLLGGMGTVQFYASLDFAEKALLIIFTGSLLICAGIFFFDRFSKWGRENRKRISRIKELPTVLLRPSQIGVCMGFELDLRAKIYLPDELRSRHVHILGATGSGKTESVILNFLKQDVARGLGSIILDAKGDMSFLTALQQNISEKKLRVFDLGADDSLTYNPLEAGTPLEAAQRLFSSLTWSEEYYKSKALSSLQRIFQNHYNTAKQNPTLSELSDYLDDPESFVGITTTGSYPKKLAEKDFMELSGLRDQARMLCLAHLERILSPDKAPEMKLENAAQGEVLYFRLQSLLSPQLVSILGKLLINHLGFLAGTAHRRATGDPKLIPVYLDEFATFACPEFADLISKARSAGYALHFSHQSIGDLVEVSEGFVSQITDNAATKIVLRINDPDSADFFARTFGTKLYQKVTQRISNVKDIDLAEIQDEGSQREAHQFRAAPDLFKGLPTGVGSVLISHGIETPHGASSVFKIRFPRLV